MSQPAVTVSSESSHGTFQASPTPHHRRRWPIVLAIAVVLAGVGGGIGLVVSHASAVAARKKAIAAQKEAVAARNRAAVQAAEVQVAETLNYCAMDLSDFVIEVENGNDEVLSYLGQQDPAYQWVMSQIGPYIRLADSQGQTQAQTRLYNGATKECTAIATKPSSGRYIAIARLPRASNYTNNSDGSSQFPLPGSMYINTPG